ncbi:NAD(P)/FAD-dependent oxidoreductase [Actinomycetospora sp.]|uniref:flavin-containing monooxygenase n=1 Tax=Actinomycetospora sp. TaxID=1872135 RepID=UPI002F414621
MTDVDVAVIGAGFAGLAALHLLRERGLRVRAYDDAGNVGGTWWWHAFPGSHLDTECHLYQYFFSEQLYRDWGWSERFPAGYEVQRWLRFVADRLDLRRDIRLSTRVVEAVHTDSGQHGEAGWTLRTDRGETVRARHLVACTGRTPVEPDLDVSAFAGLVVRTAAWPEDGHDLFRQRVGIVGTTTATVQLAPTIADRVAHLTVVADDPRDVAPRSNPVYGWQERDAYKARFAELRDAPPPGAAPVPDRDAMRLRLGGDRRLAEQLVPDGDPGRVVLDSGWLELFSRGDVGLVALGEVARVRAEGLELTDGSVVALDVLVVADEFDAGPPAWEGIEAHPSLFTVVARPGRLPGLDLQEQVAAVVGTLAP